VFAALALLLGALVAVPVAAQEAADSDQPAPPVEASAGAEPIEAVNDEDGYVWHSTAGSSRTYPGDGSSNHRYNPNGENIVVTRNGTGEYEVQFSTGGVSPLPIPTVTAFSTQGAHCNLNYFQGVSPAFARVICYDSAGTRVDSRFTLRWTTTSEDAALWSSDDGSLILGARNPFGAAPSVTRTGTGLYTVITPGASLSESSPYVTAYAGGGDHCKITSWRNNEADVACYDSSGAPTDSAFTFLRINTNDDAFVWANSALATVTYTPPTSWSHNPQGTNPTAIMTSTGNYRVTFPGMISNYGGLVSVNSFGSGSDPAKCQVTSWNATQANVACTNASGTSTNSKFNLLYTRFRTCNGVPANIEIGNNLPTNGDDVIIGTNGPDTIAALGGDDLICGLDGDDFIVGAAGNDTIFGDDGNDTISGNAGNDAIYGGTGNDIAYSGSGNDLLRGGIGNDTLGAASGTDSVFGEGGNDTISGGSDSDGEISGGDGDDNVNGGGGDDGEVYGNGGNDNVSGNGGDDKITGGPGQDSVRGGPGDDIVLGGPDNDFLSGNDGVDICDGETGVDTANTNNCETILNVP
jgi:Ca2+-binding RTX toxin-like protein